MNQMVFRNPALIVPGETCSRAIRYTRDDIAAFAAATGDTNPLHHDVQRAQRALHGEIIASGQQTAGQLMGLAASHFSRSDDGIAREVLCLNFNFAFRAPIFAEQDITLSWAVGKVEWSSRLGGWIGQLDGAASVAGKPCVIGRGTMMVKSPREPDGGPTKAPA
jgi:acyl dehydratase